MIAGNLGWAIDAELDAVHAIGGINMTLRNTFPCISADEIDLFESYLQNPLIYQPVRPNTSDYDLAYHNKERNIYEIKAQDPTNGVQLKPLYLGTIQQW